MVIASKWHMVVKPNNNFFSKTLHSKYQLLIPVPTNTSEHTSTVYVVFAAYFNE
ncbi:hypothetical protein C3B55_00587 [Candidatus Pseudomonas adelgestsugas]|uniref:Uncharacterized protein n=1 Tax=Candidatus Pseudomonas adelgestsugas TaxID=1302376 RepID=A0ABX5R8E7_9PSED|nr:hypothetical protein C3B55_00587 [Candidatus Pseudomonas adelgestsugas]